ncbi:MAG: LemA family protein [Polyangiaceae bacterium]|nr:LemA family protein [Polyangiaceae bacterium]
MATPLRRAFLLLATLLLGLFTLSACQSYDTLVEKDQIAAERWANVEANLQRRSDLVPNLVAAVKGAAAHEKDTLDRVLKARAEATSVKLSADDMNDPEKMKEFAAKQDELSKSLGRLLVIQEAYPDLKANQNFRDLQVQLEGTENRILRAREEYNAAVRDYNAEVSKVRGKVVNKVTGKPFAPRAYFEAAPGAETVPSVAF